MFRVALLCLFVLFLFWFVRFVLVILQEAVASPCLSFSETETDSFGCGLKIGAFVGVMY